MGANGVKKVEPAGYIAIGTVISTVIQVTVGAIIKLRGQHKEVKREGRQDALDEAYSVIAVLRQDSDRIRQEFNEYKEESDKKFSELWEKFTECERKHAIKEAHAKYLERIVKEKMNINMPKDEDKNDS